MNRREVGMQKAWSGLFDELRRGDIKFTKQTPTNPGAWLQHLITSVSGVDDHRVCAGIELREEIGNDFRSAFDKRPLRLRFIVGVYGPNRKHFPQPKKGFDYVRIVDAILKHVEWVKSKAAIEASETTRRDRNERQLKSMAREFRSVVHHVHVKDDGSFKFSFETDDATLVRRLLTTMKGR